MSERPTEVLKYTLDASQAEAGLVRLQQLMDQLKAKRTAGEDTSELEGQFQAQATLLEKVARGQEKAGSAAGDLIAQKQKLAAVVALAGGQFGGLISRLGSVTSLLLSMGPAIGGVAAGLAVIGVASSAWQRFQEAVARARAELKALQDQGQEVAEKQLRREMEIEGALARAGVATPETSRAAGDLDVALRKRYGIEAAPEVLAAAAKEGMTDVREVGALAMAAEAGADIEKEGAANFLQQAAARGEYEHYARAAERNVLLTRGQHVQRVAEEAGLRPGGYGDASIAEFMAKKEAGALPPGVERYSDYVAMEKGEDQKSRWEASARRRDRVRRASERADLADQLGPQTGARDLTDLVQELEKQREETRKQTALLERYLGQAERQPQVVYNQGTVIGERGDVRSRPVNPGLAPGVDVKVPY